MVRPPRAGHRNWHRIVANDMRALRTFLSGRSLAWITCVGLAMTLFIAVTERLASPGSSLWALYLLPIGFVTWFGRWRWGTLVALASMVPIAIWPDRFADPATGSVIGLGLVVRIATILALIFLLREGKRAAGEAAAGLRVDPSTGLANSRALFDLVAAERERADRYARPFTLAYVGIDNLPAVRLRSGTDAAEEILKDVALEIRATIRGVDYAARLREREFAILFPETGADSARVAVDRIRDVLMQLFEGERHAVTFSVGVITWHQSDLSTEALHQRTYQLMYAARHDADPIRHEILELPVIAGIINDRRRA